MNYDGAVMLSVRFERELPVGFDSYGGRWRAARGQLSQQQAEGISLLAAGDPGWHDYTASTRVRFAPNPERGAEAGLVLQCRDPGNYLVFSLKHKEGGPFAVLRIECDPGLRLVGDQANLSLDLADWHELRADVHGVDIYCYVDGEHVVDFSFAGTPPAYNAHGSTWPQDPTHGRVGLITVGAVAHFSDFTVRCLSDLAHIVTPQGGRRDAAGRLLPRQSYADTMRRFTEWMIRADAVTNKQSAPEPIRTLPAYLITNFLGVDDALWNVGGEFAFNHALAISGCVQYYAFSGDRRALDIGVKLADWHIGNSTPATAALPHLSPSVVTWQPDGRWEGAGWGLEPDKSAYMALAYLKLHAATDRPEYRDAALRIAGTLRLLQQPDGSWPFRVNPQTGEVRTGYTCSQLWYVWLFERLAAMTSDPSYARMRDQAFRWLLDNPVSTNRWIGLYGDIVSDAQSYDQWVALETAMYLIDRRRESPGYLSQAQQILEWVLSALGVDYGLHPGVTGVVEQSDYQVVLTHHELRLAEIYAKLWEATGDPTHKERAIETANSVTWGLMSDGKMRQGFWAHAAAVPLTLCFNDQFCRIMASIPETAPENENHLLATGSFLRRVDYAGSMISYRTMGASADAVSVIAPPKSVRAGGRALPPVAADDEARDGWIHDSRTRLLRVRHRAPDVEVEVG